MFARPPARPPARPQADRAGRRLGRLHFVLVSINKGAAWWSQKQKSIATRSADAESRALGTGVSRGLELQYVADELGVSTPTRLNAFTDATAAIGFAKNNGGATRMRHIDVREGWVQQNRNRKNLSIHKILGTDNPSDFFTKIMAKSEFARTSMNLNGTLQLKPTALI